MHCIRSYLNYGWWTKRQFQIRVSISQDISKFWLFPSLITSPRSSSGVEKRLFYGGLPKCLKAMVAYLKAGPQVRTYSNYLRAAQEAKKEDSTEPSHSPRTRVTDTAPKPQPSSFFPLLKLKGNQATPKVPAMQLVHLEEEVDRGDEDEGNDDSNRINGVTKEFMVCLARAVKDAQTDEKCCYHCCSPEHFIHNCLLMMTLREKQQLNGKEGIALEKGAWTPLTTAITPKNLQMEVPKA